MLTSHVRAKCRSIWGSQWYDVDAATKRERKAEAKRQLMQVDKEEEKEKEEPMSDSVAACRPEVDATPLLSPEKTADVVCGGCDRSMKGAHAYIIKWENGRTGFRSGYMTACTHLGYDMEPWCSTCAMVVESSSGPQVRCSTCTHVDWGTPKDTSVDFYCPDSVWARVSY